MDIYQLSFKNFKRKKLRSALTVLGIVIGVIALVALLGFVSGTTSYMKERIENIGGDVIIANSTGAYIGTSTEYLDPNTVSKIVNMSQLYDIKKETSFNIQLNNTSTIVIGMNNWNQIKIKGTPGVVMGKTLADTLGYKIGDKISIKGREFTITGVTSDETMRGRMGREAIYMDIDKALSLNDNRVTDIIAKTKGDPEVVAKEIENTVNGAKAITQSDFTKEIDEMMSGLMLFLGAIASVALLVGTISILNIMLVNVTERTREIGILKAIGFTNREILLSILAEAGFLGFIGALIGVVIAAIILKVGTTWFFKGIENISQMLPLWLVGGVICGVTLLSILASLYPAWKASKLNVVEALRYE